MIPVIKAAVVFLSIISEDWFSGKSESDSDGDGDGDGDEQKQKQKQKPFSLSCKT